MFKKLIEAATKTAGRKAVSTFVVSASRLGAIEQHEGFRDTAYYATAQEKKEGISTIGYGSTFHANGTKVKPGDKITREQAQVLLKDITEEKVKKMAACIKVPVSRYEFEAYTSLTFNIGTSAFCNSTLVTLLNQERYDEACRQILRWDKQRGVVLPGLTKRRKEEYNLCMKKE